MISNNNIKSILMVWSEYVSLDVVTTCRFCVCVSMENCT